MDKYVAFMENKWNQIMTRYNLYQLEYRQILKDYACSYFTESGNSNDIADYYIEAEEKNLEKKKGLISKMVDWFKNIFKKIMDKVRSMFGKDKQYLMYKETPTIQQKIKDFLAKMKKAVNDFRNSITGKSIITSLKQMLILIGILNIPRIVQTASNYAWVIIDAKKSNNMSKAFEFFKEEVDFMISLVTGKTNKSNDSEEVDTGFSLLNILKDLARGLMNILEFAIRPYTNAVRSVMKGVGVYTVTKDSNTNQYLFTDEY